MALKYFKIIPTNYKRNLMKNVRILESYKVPGSSSVFKAESVAIFGRHVGIFTEHNSFA